MAKEITVYLSGPMYKSKEESTKWRNEVKAYIKNWLCEQCSCTFGYSGVPPPRVFNCDYVGFNVLDPCDRWFNTREEANENSSWVVKIDKMEIAKSDVLIVNACDNAYGTPMEQYMAYEAGKFVIAFCDKEFPSIWAKEHCHIMAKSHIEAAEWLCQHSREIARTL
jgi:nucleoside 2-deoxyribosyltransferase